MQLVVLAVVEVAEFAAGGLADGEIVGTSPAAKALGRKGWRGPYEGS
jgi:hypothetical protein